MRKWEIVKGIFDSGIMTTIRTNSIDRAEEIVEAGLVAGINVLEFSFNSKESPEIIQYIRNKYGNKVFVGAGTILDAFDAKLAIRFGAQFIIAPNFNKEVAKICNREQIPYCPGCTTITEVIMAAEYGASFIKLFPASNFWGADAVKVINTPLPQLPILASGGVTLDNIVDWKKSGVACCGIGSLLTKGTKAEIEYNAKEIVRLLKST